MGVCLLYFLEIPVIIRQFALIKYFFLLHLPINIGLSYIQEFCLEGGMYSV